MVTHSQSAARWRQLSESMCTGGCLAGRLWVPRWQVGCLAGWLPEGCTGHVRRRSSPQSSLRAWSSTAIVKSTSALVQHMGGLMRKTLPARPAAAEQHSRTANHSEHRAVGRRRRCSQAALACQAGPASSTPAAAGAAAAAGNLSAGRECPLTSLAQQQPQILAALKHLAHLSSGGLLQPGRQAGRQAGGSAQHT